MFVICGKHSDSQIHDKCHISSIKEDKFHLFFLLEKSVHFLKDFIYLFLERGGGRKKQKERNINVWLPLSCTPLGTWPANQTCTLAGNRPDDLLFHMPARNLLSHTSQGRKLNMEVKFS